ncbi:MAG: glycoside hydrolase family 6 protein, partial [Actinomycetota bacterium]|nr:glycoside hydrolase family 6 protein [Actinomycetota bacterium]
MRTPKRLCQLAALTALALLATVAGARAAGAQPVGSPMPVLATNPGNPLAGRTWTLYNEHFDALWNYWNTSTGATKQALANIALQPHPRWFGPQSADSDIQRQLAAYISVSNGGDPSKLVQVTFFRLTPWENAACSQSPTPAQQASYRTWMGNAARAIGSNHVAVILQPDLT